MRRIANVVVVLSLLVAAVSVAGPGDQSAPAAPPATEGAGAPAGTTSAPASAEDVPTAVRTRRLEQRTQALKERAWQLKARVQMLKEQVLGGGVGAQSLISHSNDMGAAFRLIKLTYTLDGTQIFTRTDESGETLYKTKSFDIFTGPIAPGNHNLSIVATYRGHGYGVFEYLSKFTFTAQGQASFSAGEGKITRVECKGHEKGGPATPMEKRAAVECKVAELAPDKPAEPAQPTTPGTTPLPPPAPAPAAGAGK